MIDDKLAGFLELPLFGWLGSRDADRVPQVHRCSGWRLSDSRDQLICCVADPFTDELPKRLAEHAELALLVANGATHETYQLKGRALGTREPDDDDRATCDAYREKMLPFYQYLGFESGDRAFPPPRVAIELRVDEIFVQTPGPEAGKRIASREER